MISLDIFTASEPKMLHLAKIWNIAEANPTLYDDLFVSNPHELADLIGSGTTYNDWQDFISDSRVQEYIDRVIYTRAGIIVNKYFKDRIHLSQADSARLNTAIKYRDDHKEEYAIPVQYIYMQTPLTFDEKEFLTDESPTY
ncbi:MAG: hypothetical protein J6R47_05805 [Acholeplasmatales bacterium]|nr:hypothetical protein [Acholeplasmatales bacterium]